MFRLMYKGFVYAEKEEGDLSEKFNTQGAGRRLLLIFSEEGCMREELPAKREGEYFFYLTMQVTGREERKMMCYARQGNWYVGEYLLSESAPVYLSDDNGQLLFLLSREMQELRGCQSVQLEPEEIVRIGKSYRNTVFYECFSFIKTQHLEIVCEDNVYVLNGFGHKGIYWNEKALSGRCRLKAGDRIDLYGMHILVLKEFLVVCSFQGIRRVARQCNLESLVPQKEEDYHQKPVWVERYSREEMVLHTGEVEILPPSPMERTNKSPLLLGLGPSLTMVLPILIMAFAGSRSGQAAEGSFYYLSVVMSVCSSFLALFWGLVNHFYAKHQSRTKEHHRVVQYREYLAKTEAYLRRCQEENRNILEKRYPAVGFFDREGKGAIVMWDRFYRQKDFLFLRVGIGSIPFQMQVKSPGEKSIVPEILWQEAKKLSEDMSVLSGVPVGIDFRKVRILGITGREGIEEGIHGILLQLLFQVAACHSYTEVKVICFCEKQNEQQSRIARQLQWMPHCWSGNRRIRFIAGNEQEAAEILPALTKELESHRENEKKNLPWYLFLVLSEELIQGEPIYQRLMNKSDEYPISAVFLKKNREELPVGCDCIICKTDKAEEMTCYREDGVSRHQIKPDLCEEAALERYVRQISGCRVRAKEKEERIPEQVSFLELYQVTKVQQLSCIKRWESHKPEERMKIPLGIRAGGGIVCLDIHEKFHGPHGLIAGTTGSGKSELIQTCILSVAVSFSPQDVNFFMVDYKGGGTGNMLQSLPHCSGVISNLSGKQIKRAMSAISSENRRRQKLLSKYQVNHIDGYMDLFRLGKAKEPMPHLLLVVDEFAELKKEEPEFMQEMISLAQVGRSLGMHLILATQKPAGTVDDKIWSNARFRLCLRVQDKQDSMDMLHKKDAALLTQPGQCYLQIGNDEYFELFQTAYCGGVYHEEGEEKDKVLLVTPTGKRCKVYKEVKKEDTRTQLETVLNYVNHVAEKNGYEKARSLWMPELKQRITLDEIREEQHTDFDKDSYILGMYDDPANQQQGPVIYRPRQQGHLAVCGSPATGKTTLLQTLLWQLGHRMPEDVRILIADPGGGLGQGFQTFPQLLGYLYREEDKQVFFYHLEQTFEERKLLLSGMNYLQYEKAGKGKVPEIYFVIDNYHSLAKLLSEHQEEFLLRLAAEGINYGFYMVLSATAMGEIPGKLFGKIKKTIALEMSEKFAYGDILRQYHLDVYPAENVKGRGLCREKDEILEFQTALLVGEEEDYLRMKTIRREGECLKAERLEKEKELPKVFPRIPECVESTVLCNTFAGERQVGYIPLGYDTENGRIHAFQVEGERFLILGAHGTGRRTLLAHLAEALTAQGMQVVLYDSKSEFGFFRERYGLQILNSWEELQEWRSRLKEGEKYYMLIVDLCEFVRKLYQNRENTALQKAWEEEAAGLGMLTFMAGCCSGEGDYEVQGTTFFREFVRRQQGICLGGNVANQRILQFDDLNYSMQTRREKPGIGYFKNGAGAETIRLKLPVYEGRENCGHGRCGSAGAGSDL